MHHLTGPSLFYRHPARDATPMLRIAIHARGQLQSRIAAKQAGVEVRCSPTSVLMFAQPRDQLRYAAAGYLCEKRERGES